MTVAKAIQEIHTMGPYMNISLFSLGIEDALPLTDNIIDYPNVFMLVENFNLKSDLQVLRDICNEMEPGDKVKYLEYDLGYFEMFINNTNFGTLTPTELKDYARTPRNIQYHTPEFRELARTPLDVRMIRFNNDDDNYRINKILTLESTGSGHEFITKLPYSIGYLTELEYLRLDGVNITSIPDSIGNLTKLEQLYLDECKKLDTIPESIGNLTNLKQLDLSSCEKLDTIPESIGNLTKLERLYLSNCELLDTIPESIGNLTNLKKLDLRGTAVPPERIEELRQLIPKCIIYSEPQ